MNIKLLKQETPCNAKFNTPTYMTRGFQSEFGDLAAVVAFNTIFKIQSERVQTDAGADYLQIVECDGKKFWVIDSESYVTFLLPSEY